MSMIENMPNDIDVIYQISICNIFVPFPYISSFANNIVVLTFLLRVKNRLYSVLPLSSIVHCKRPHS
jgi:hypothetical protein